MKSAKNYCPIYFGTTVVALALGIVTPTFATSIDFENAPNSPNIFNSANPSPQSVTIDGVTFGGGVILSGATFLTADPTSVYGTASFANNLSNPMVISNPTGFNNFFFNLINGQLSSATYLVADNAGHSASYTLAPNTQNGMTLVNFASTATQITITDIGETQSWDFFIDNFNFNVPSGAPAVPEATSTIGLFAGALVGLAAVAKFRRATA